MMQTVERAGDARHGKRLSRLLIGASALSLTVMLASGEAHATAALDQDQPSVEAPEAVTVEEIIVTARSRAERLQDVPLIVNVVTEEALEQQGIKDIFDLSRIAPSFAYVATVRGQANINMRGLSPSSLVPQKQGVSFFLDGVNIPGEVTSMNLQDIAQVEVLKGPQSAHFGRSTYAGAVNYSTSIPELDVLNGRLTAEYSSYGSHDVSGILSFPIIQDRLYASISARSFERGGLYTERNYGMEVGEQESQNYALNLLFRPQSGTTVRLRASHDRDDDGHQVSYTLYRQDMAAYDQVFPTGATYPVFTVTGAQPELLGASCGTGNLAGRCGDRQRERTFVYGIVEHAFENGYTVNYSTSYFDEYNDWAADVTNRWLGDPMLDNPAQVLNPIQNRTRATSHQLRLESPANERFTWLVGLYHMRDAYTTDTLHGRITLNPFVVAPGYPATRITPSRTDNKAIYFSGSYELTENLTVTAEGRFQWERLFVRECDLSQCQYYGAAMEVEENDFLPRITLDYQFSPDFMVYALYSEGVKSGVLNTSTSVTTQAAALAFQEANYQSPEYVTNYEVGAKGTFHDGLIAFQAAAFHMEVENQQISTFGVNAAGATTSVTGNGGASRINGFEFAAQMRPTYNWDIDAGVGYAHHEYVGGQATNATLINLYGANSPRASLDGLTSQQTPRWTGNISTEYRWPIFENDILALRVDYTYLGRRFVDVPNLIALEPVERTNVALRWEHDDLTLTLFAKNLFDVDEVFDAGPGYGNVAEQRPHPRSGQSPSIIVNLPYPRTIGARLSYRF